MDWSAFVGLPWKDRGRDEDGCDCYGLAILCYRAGLGVELPSYAANYAASDNPEDVDGLISAQREPWTAIWAKGQERCGLVKARPFDLVLMIERPWHIGIVVKPGWMLHMPGEKTSVIEQYTTGRHFPRVEGIYRHESQI